MQTLGDKLSEARQRLGMRIQDAADATHIRKDYLEALENNQFEQIPLSDVYRRGYVKIYARYLRLDAGIALRDYEQTAEERGIRSSGPASRGGARLSPGVFDRGDSASYDKDLAHSDRVGDGDSAAGFAPPSALKPGKRHTHASDLKSKAWLYVAVALTLVVFIGAIWKAVFTRNDQGVKQDASHTSSAGTPGDTSRPAHYAYRLEIFVLKDTIVDVRQEKDNRQLLSRRQMRPPKTTEELGLEIVCEGAVNVYAPDLKLVYVRFGGKKGSYYWTKNPNASYFHFDPVELGLLPAPSAR